MEELKFSDDLSLIGFDVPMAIIVVNAVLSVNLLVDLAAKLRLAKLLIDIDCHWNNDQIVKNVEENFSNGVAWVSDNFPSFPKNAMALSFGVGMGGEESRSNCVENVHHHNYWVLEDDRAVAGIKDSTDDIDVFEDSKLPANQLLDLVASRS